MVAPVWLMCPAACRPHPAGKDHQEDCPASGLHCLQGPAHACHQGGGLCWWDVLHVLPSWRQTAILSSLLRALVTSPVQPLTLTSCPLTPPCSAASTSRLAVTRRSRACMANPCEEPSILRPVLGSCTCLRSTGIALWYLGFCCCL